MHFNNILYYFKSNITKEFTGNIVEFDDIICAIRILYICELDVIEHDRCFDSILSVPLFEPRHNIAQYKQRH